MKNIAWSFYNRTNQLCSQSVMPLNDMQSLHNYEHRLFLTRIIMELTGAPGYSVNYIFCWVIFLAGMFTEKNQYDTSLLFYLKNKFSRTKCLYKINFVLSKIVFEYAFFLNNLSKVHITNSIAYIFAWQRFRGFLGWQVFTF